MNMNELIRDLKGAALKATPGPWHGWGVGDEVRNIYQTSHVTRDVWKIAECHHSPDTDVHFIALANPKNILDLCEYIEKLNEKYGKENGHS